VDLRRRRKAEEEMGREGERDLLPISLSPLLPFFF